MDKSRIEGDIDDFIFIKKSNARKVTIDIGSLHKKEGYIWIKQTEKRVGHYRRVKGVKNDN